MFRNKNLGLTGLVLLAAGCGSNNVNTQVDKPIVRSYIPIVNYDSSSSYSNTSKTSNTSNTSGDGVRGSLYYNGNRAQIGGIQIGSSLNTKPVSSPAPIKLTPEEIEESRRRAIILMLINQAGNRCDITPNNGASIGGVRVK